MKQDKLKLWQDRLARNGAAYEAVTALMDQREKVYRGSSLLRKMVAGDRKRCAAHVRNLAAELIEAQVISSVPQPKVTAKRPQDEKKAKLIEDMLRNELDRLPFEQLNDMMERTVPIQGGALFLVEWDSTRRTHTTAGELAVSVLHPKQVIPQDGVYTGIEDMDYILLKLPQTKEFIKRRHGVDVSDEGEREPEVKAGEGRATSEDMVTQYVAYYRNGKGGIGRYSWVNDVELEDLEDYQARRLRRCTFCGEPEPLEFGGSGGSGAAKVCQHCGGKKWTDGEQEYEELYNDVVRSDGSVIPGEHPAETGEAPVWVGEIPVMEDSGAGPSPLILPVMEPTRIPYYKPDLFPVILQKNVSVFGQFLGDSDIDKIADQQNTVNRVESKIIDKLLKSGSYLILPDEASIRADAEDMKVIRPGSPANAQMIGVKDLEGNVSQDMNYLAQVYEEARQTIGVTDSFQGRRDTTATSGRAKEFSAAQAAGRLESKRVMKDAAYAALFEAMFKFKLAYTDEARPVASRDLQGNKVYEEFNRYDFLEQDAAGEWYWNDQFLFSCDTTAPLASNREAMWQETRQNLQSGAFGDPTSLETLVLFWTKMELLHYPGAGETKAYLEQRLQTQREQAALEQQTILAQMQRAGGVSPTAGQSGIPPGTMGVPIQQTE